MPWTALPTFITGDLVTAAHLNTIGGNLDIARPWMLFGEHPDCDPSTARFTSFGASTAQASDVARLPFPISGVIDLLYARSSAAPGSSETFQVTVYRDGSSTALTLDIDDTAQENSDVSNSVSVTAGTNAISVLCSATNGTPANTRLMLAARFTPD